MKLDLEKVINDINNQRYSVSHEVLSKDEAVRLLDIFSNHIPALKPAGIGKGENFVQEGSIRNDQIVWIAPDSNEEMGPLFFNTIHEMMTELNRNFYIGLRSYEFHFARYDKGSFYKKHKDAFRNDDARRISVVLYLNQNWKHGDGGELVIYNENEEITIEPKCGTLVVFESVLEHEVLPSNRERISLTGWLKNKTELI